MNRKEVINRVEKLCAMDINRTQATRETITIMKDKHNIPSDISFDILSLKNHASNVDDAILYSIIEAKDIVNNTNTITQYFKEKEIAEYSSYQYSELKMSFPIVLNMVEISDDQWIGKINVKQLMELRNANLINYNERTQRAMSRSTINGEVIYRITINKNAVKAITNSYESNEYIPNTITLNMGLASDYTYDEDKGKLIINSLDKFDIIDGYHRYISMSNLYNVDNNFNYDMELRIVAFSENKAKRFIWQEDQKTKMTRVQSNAMNTSTYSNKVVSIGKDRLLLSDLFSQHKINEAILIDIVDKLYFNNREKYSIPELLQISNQIFDGVESVLKLQPELYQTNWDYNYLAVLLYYIHKGLQSKDLIDKTKEVIEKFRIEEKLDQSNTGRHIKRVINRLNKEEGGEM